MQLENKHLINEDDFIKAFSKVIKNDDQVIVLYSGLWSFIFNIRFKNKNISKKLLELIENLITKKKTLLLPASSGEEFINKKEFHLDKSLDRNGLLPLEALKSGKYYRTPQPLHSYLAIGKHVKEIKDLCLETSWGKKSLFQWLSDKNARMCVLGVPWNIGCSYLHRYEELNLVPWRYFKIFEGNMFNKGKKVGPCKEAKYSKFIDLKYDLQPIVKEINNNKFLKYNGSKFFLESITCNEIDFASKKFFKKDPWKIVLNKKDVKKWIHSKKEALIQ